MLLVDFATLIGLVGAMMLDRLGRFILGVLPGRCFSTSTRY